METITIWNKVNKIKSKQDCYKVMEKCFVNGCEYAFPSPIADLYTDYWIKKEKGRCVLTSRPVTLRGNCFNPCVVEYANGVCNESAEREAVKEFMWKNRKYINHKYLTLDN